MTPAWPLGRLPAWVLAGLAALCQAPFVILRVQRAAFDADTHLFLASHYQAQWWNLWEPRWYLGFSMAAYPPLAHQLLALLGGALAALIGAFAPGPEPYPGAFQLLGLEAAFVLVLTGALALLPLAVRGFARLFVGPAAADAAGLCAVFAPAVALSAWAFGQLPTILATVVLLAAVTRGADYVRRGRPRALAEAALLAGLAAVLHHAVFLLAPAAGLAAAWAAGREAGWRVAGRRALIWAGLSAGAVVSGLWPFLQWSQGQALQTPIAHASRGNFLTDPVAGLFFFWPMYGPLLAVFPLALWLGRRGRRRGLLAAVAGLAALGLGGTTPLPRLLFGAGWEWLTYDRFALWAALLVLPFAGAGLIRWWRRRAVWVWLAALAVSGWAAGAWSLLARAQPPAVDLAPLVAFLNQPEQRPYRYVTLGFGDQFARLSVVTGNGSPDGNYHTARPLPELRASGLGALDTARWNPAGLPALTPLLARAGDYGLRWALVNHPDYAPALRAAGWEYRFAVGAVAAWEFPAARPAARREPAGFNRSPAALWWGGAPLGLLTLTLLTLGWGRWRGTRPTLIRLLAGLRLGLWAATLALGVLWWFYPAQIGGRPRVYFTYQSTVVFAAEITAALSVLAWAGERVLRRAPPRLGPRGLILGGLAVLAATAGSIPGAEDRSLAMAFGVQLLVLAGLYLALINDPPPASAAALASGALLLLLALVALDQVLAQRTLAMNLPWPGALAAADRGASVIQNAAGERWLRAYATLPHPNLLAGVLVVLLPPVLERYLQAGQRRWLALAGLGWLTLGLTFSRAGWLGAVVILVAAVWRAERARRPLALAAGLLPLALAGALAGPFFLARTPLGAGLPLEQRSVDERQMLAVAGLKLWAERPLFGVGAGNFVIALDQVLPDGQRREPVHNVWLLLAAETGVLGFAAGLILTAVIARELWRRRGGSLWPTAWLAIGLLALSDHFWWSLPLMRLWWVVALAWATVPPAGGYNTSNSRSTYGQARASAVSETSHQTAAPTR